MWDEDEREFIIFLFKLTYYIVFKVFNTENLSGKNKIRVTCLEI